MGVGVGMELEAAGAPVAVADGRGIGAGIGADGRAAGNMPATPSEKLQFPPKRRCWTGPIAGGGGGGCDAGVCCSPCIASDVLSPRLMVAIGAGADADALLASAVVSMASSAAAEPGSVAVDGLSMSTSSPSSSGPWPSISTSSPSSFGPWPSISTSPSSASSSAAASSVSILSSPASLLFPFSAAVGPEVEGPASLDPMSTSPSTSHFFLAGGREGGGGAEA